MLLSRGNACGRRYVLLCRVGDGELLAVAYAKEAMLFFTACTRWGFRMVSLMNTPTKRARSCLTFTLSCFKYLNGSFVLVQM